MHTRETQTEVPRVTSARRAAGSGRHRATLVLLVLMLSVELFWIATLAYLLYRVI